jgi:hypothetical protein
VDRKFLECRNQLLSLVSQAHPDQMHNRQEISGSSFSLKKVSKFFLTVYSTVLRRKGNELNREEKDCPGLHN